MERGSRLGCVGSVALMTGAALGLTSGAWRTGAGFGFTTASTSTGRGGVGKVRVWTGGLIAPPATALVTTKLGSGAVTLTGRGFGLAGTLGS